MTVWTESVPAEQLSAVAAAAISQGRCGADERSVVFHDLDRLRGRATLLRSHFPPQTLHAVAIKANPLVEILRVAVDAGCGLEAASFEEVHIGLLAGCQPERIVFDSPAKTRVEIAQALELGVVLNADNFDELSRIHELRARMSPACRVGLRVNPMVGEGRIGITSVAGASSKFGVRLDSDVAAILDAFDRYPWLLGLHIHVGSQGCDLDLLAEAAIRIVQLVDRIECRAGAGRIDFVDIGGGLPVTYADGDAPPELDDYVGRLRTLAPGLFDPSRRLITEFGRAFHAGSGFALTRVEYVKSLGDKPLAIVHLGADMFMRPVYLPMQWQHRYLLLDPSGSVKSGPRRPWTIGGPLCFAGDILARDVSLPDAEPGDYIAVRDTGAYTLSMWSRHCSRGLPLVLGYQGSGPEFRLLRERERPGDVARFWSASPEASRSQCS